MKKIICFTLISIVCWTVSASAQSFVEHPVLSDTLRYIETVRSFDIDSDGDNDLLVCENIGNPIGSPSYRFQLHLFVNDGQGNFTHQVVVTGYKRLQDVFVCDLDHDGVNELLVGGGREDSTFTILKRDGERWSENAVPSEPYINEIVAGDINGDGLIEIVVGTLEKFTWDIFRGMMMLHQLNEDGDYTKIPLTNFEWGGWANLAITDMDGDGKPNLVANHVSEFKDLDTWGGWWEMGGIETVFHPFPENISGGSRYGNINGNDRTDVVAHLSNGASVWFEYDADNNPIIHPLLPDSLAQLFRPALPFDYDNDGDLDILIPEGIVLVNDGSGGFTSFASQDPICLDQPVSDLNGDGYIDMVRIRRTEPFQYCLLYWVENRLPLAVNDLSDEPLPQAFAITCVYPNPFNPSTIVSYSLNRPGSMRMEVLDINGRLVTRLVEGAKPAGSYSVTWDAKNSPAGVYFVRLTDVAGGMVSRKVVLLK